MAVNDRPFSQMIRVGFFGLVVLSGFAIGLSIIAGFKVEPLSDGEPLVTAIKSTRARVDLPVCTVFTDEEYRFSLCYPVSWAVPEGEAIEPPQQHLYQLTFNPKADNYLVNVYDRPAPISLGSFIRDYFPVVEWTNEIEVNDQPSLQFFIPEGASKPSGVGGIAFARAKLVVTITTPTRLFSGGDFKQLVEDEELVKLAQSFVWLEE